MTNTIKGLSENEKKAIAAFEALLVQRFPKIMRRIVLFGSKARGDFHKGSDIDLLVVLAQHTKLANKEVAILTHEPIAKYGVDISPITVGEKFFKEWSPLLEHIKEDGIVLWIKNKAKNNISN